LIELLRTIRASSEIPGALSSLRTQSLFYQLLYETIAGCQHRIHKPESTVIVQDAIEFIQVNYMYPITLTELAERYQISAGFFSSQFRKQTGMSPIDYLIRFRVRRAKELLAASRYSVREIAQSVGYAYVYYFSRLFKQHTGFSPSQLRPSPNGVD
jgi:transcriptional regulator GlxA family with amidase domain